MPFSVDIRLVQVWDANNTALTASQQDELPTGSFDDGVKNYTNSVAV